MVTKRVSERRQRMAELAQADRANRCAYCKKALEKARWKDALETGVYCSLDCLDSAEEWAAERLNK